MAEPVCHSPQGVSIVIPAYNEEQGIGKVLAHLFEVMRHTATPYEIMVVDDGSDDATAEVVEKSGQATLLRHRHNRGYGAALKTGIRHARFSLIGITDADGTYPNERLPDLVERMGEQEYDMVVGARKGEHVAIPLVRRPAKWVINQLANFVAGEAIPDLNSGLRVFRRDAALQLLPLLPDGFSFTTTITLAMLTNNYLVDYIPVNYHARIGKSKIRPIRDTLNFVQLVLRIGLYFAPLKLFLPVSGFLLALAAVWGVVSALVFGRLADVSTLVIAMAGIQVAVVGLLADLIDRRTSNIYRKE
ncbi:MAG: glycosyltransferase family 2 protein [Chloroflexaceae bacterium]|nr:glycosyltransferase family 2 protein [Chloroflexaceae bacterium]